MKIKIKPLRPGVQLPTFQTAGSAAMDISAAIDEAMILAPMERRIIPTGFAMELPVGFEAQVRARSGLSLKHGITLANGIGTIDADYRGEVGVILANISQEPFVIEPGMRIAQLVIARYEQVEWEQATELTDTDRGEGGYGSTAH